MVCLAQNGWCARFRSIKVAGSQLGGWGICVASYVHDHHSVWVTRLSARVNDTVISVTIAFILFSLQSGDTALHEASRYGHLEVVKLLLQSHADVNVKNNVST